MQFRTPYDPERYRVSISFLDEDGNQAIGRTKQAHKDECDIKVIMQKYDKTGLISHVNQAQAQYGDFSEINEYKESLEFVMRSKANFEALPSALRKRFKQDPGEFLEFITNPDNASEMVSLGLAEAIQEPPKPTKPAPAEPVETE